MAAPPRRTAAVHRWNSCEAVWKSGKLTQSHTFVLVGQQLARSKTASFSDPLLYTLLRFLIT